MITLKVRPKNKEPLLCVIESDAGPLTTNIPVDSLPEYHGHGCGSCHEVQTSHGCNLLTSLAPIIYYFSDIISYEEVSVEFCRDRYHSTYPETAQKICFALCVYAMFYSSCKFFGQFKFLLKYYRANFDPDAYMHMVLTTALIRRQVDLKTIHDHVDIFQEVAMFNERFKKRLQLVFGEARYFENKDAAINAITIAFSLNTLTTEALKDFYEEFLDNIKKLH